MELAWLALAPLCGALSTGEEAKTPSKLRSFLRPSSRAKHLSAEMSAN